jgi:hypothetical protein
MITIEQIIKAAKMMDNANVPTGRRYTYSLKQDRVVKVPESKRKRIRSKVK